MTDEACAKIITPRKLCRPEPGEPDLLLRAPFVAIDIETTGTSAMDQIVEIGAVRFTPEGTVIDRFSSIANPGNHVPLNPAAERIHGIAAADIRAAPPLRNVLKEFRTYVGNHGLVAHNLAFENRFLSAAYHDLDETPPAWQGICTLQAARRHLDAASNKLDYLLTLFGIDAQNSHRASDDAHACGLLLAELIRRRGVTSLEPLHAPAQQEPAQSQPERVTVAAAPPPAPVSAADINAAFGGHAPTDEQSFALERFQTGQPLRITAVAGSGKSSTLLGMARLEKVRNPSRRGHLIAFNRSVADELKRKVPDTLAASTAHSLAYRHIRRTTYGPLLTKLNAPRSSWRTVIDAVGAEKMWLNSSGRQRPLAEYTIARLALSTVEKYCQTTDEHIGAHHVPFQPGVAGTDVQDLREKVVRCARRAWANLLDPNRFEVKFTPSHYLKLWAMTEPKFGNPGDYIMFDEAQDASPILRDIVVQQTHLQQVFVGDSAQAIYRFTGAVNALAELGHIESATLTQSFRFGDAIADAANVYLDKLGEAVRVRGNPAMDSRIVDGRPADACLCRTNADAIAEVMAAQKSGMATAFEGDVAAAIRFCESADLLKDGMNPKDPELMAFDSWVDLGEYVDNMPGVSELGVFYSLVDEHGTDAIRNTMESLVDRRRAALTVLTAHKAKGLEFNRVRINSNWELDDEADEDERIDEQRLAYVALTRARRELDPGMLLGAEERRNANSARDPFAGGTLFDLPERSA